MKNHEKQITTFSNLQEKADAIRHNIKLLDEDLKSTREFFLSCPIIFVPYKFSLGASLAKGEYVKKEYQKILKETEKRIANGEIEL